MIKGTKYKEIYDKNASWNTKIESQVVSLEMLDLINKATKSEPDKRVSIDEFLNHDVFSFEISDDEELSISYDPTKQM